jgi:hypothetical protein
MADKGSAEPNAGETDRARIQGLGTAAREGAQKARPRVFHSSGPFLFQRPGRPLTTIISDDELRSSIATIDSEAFLIHLAQRQKPDVPTVTKRRRPG